MTISFKVIMIYDFEAFLDCPITELMLETDKDKHITDWEVAEGKTGTANLLGHAWTGKSWQQVNWGS